MKEHYQLLLSLTETSPDINSSTGYSQLNTILNKYTAILRCCNEYSDYYKKATNVYYGDISAIRDNIQTSLYGQSTTEKQMAFDKASGELKSNIRALAKLIQQHEEIFEMA